MSERNKIGLVFRPFAEELSEELTLIRGVNPHILIEPVEDGDILFNVDATGISPEEVVSVLRLIADTIEATGLEVKE